MLGRKARDTAMRLHEIDSSISDGRLYLTWKYATWAIQHRTSAERYGARVAAIVRAVPLSP